MSMRKIIKMFENGNVQVAGMKGSGKDMLFANVIARRKKPYISNTNYGGFWIRFDPKILNCNNTWRNFITGHINRYDYPFGDDIDFYLSDSGLYMPSQYQGELVRDYGYLATFFPLTRQLGESRFHSNTQAFSRLWDKLREQGDQWILCKKCKVFFKRLVVQKVWVYDRCESAVNAVPPFPLKRPLFNLNRVQLYEIQKANYLISHGNVTPMTLIYFNRSKYNTRIFKEILEKGDFNA